MTAAAANGLEALRATAKASEPDRYLAALLAPVAIRDASLALAAFAAELRHIPAAVREPMMGEIRLQWWRDALAALGRGERTGHAIADALAPIVREGMPIGLMLAPVEARAFDLYPDPMPDEATLAGYLAKTEGAFFEMAAGLAGGSAEEPRSKAAMLTGRAYGQARLLSELPLWLSRGRLPLPLTLLADAGVEPAALLAGECTPAVRAMLDTLADEARSTCAAARKEVAGLPSSRRTAFLPLAMVEPYLAAVESRRRDPLRQKLEIAPLVRVWRIGAAHWLRRI